MAMAMVGEGGCGFRRCECEPGEGGAFVELCLVLRSAAAIAARRRQSSAAWCRGFVGNGHGKTAMRLSTTLTRRTRHDSVVGRARRDGMVRNLRTGQRAESSSSNGQTSSLMGPPPSRQWWRMRRQAQPVRHQL